MPGKLGIPYIGTASGKEYGEAFRAAGGRHRSRLHQSATFPPAPQANKVRILWEPYPGGANIAINPVGFEALFKGFNDSPYVGLQYDPSHLVWQMMDPIQTARDFVDKIYDVHLKDTEVRWDVLRKVGINPLNRAQWWVYRLPSLGSDRLGRVLHRALRRAGYQGAMSMDACQDPLYGSPNRPGPDFSTEYAMGFRMAHRYLRQYVPE